MRIGHLAIIVQILPGARAELSTDRHIGELFTGGVCRPTDAAGEHDSGAMTFSIVALAGATPASLWEHLNTQNLLSGTLADIEEAHRLLVTLSAETDWQVRSKSIRALHDVLSAHAQEASEVSRILREETTGYLS